MLFPGTENLYLFPTIANQGRLEGLNAWMTEGACLQPASYVSTPTQTQAYQFH